MTTTTPPPASTRGAGRPRPPGPGGGRPRGTSAFRFLAGGLLSGAGLGVAVAIGTWPFGGARTLDWSLVAAGGLVLLGAGFLTRSSVSASRPVAVVSALALILGALTLGAAATGSVAAEAGGSWSGAGFDGGDRVPDEQGSIPVDPDLGEVRFNLDRGRLEVVEAADAEPALTFATRGDARLGYEELDGALVVTGRCPGWWFWLSSPGCATDVQMTVPTGTGVVADHGFGGVSLTGLSGPVTVEVGAADIDVSDVRGELDLETGAGDITATGVDSDVVTVESGAGDLDLAFTAAPGEVDISSGVGDVRVGVPAGTYATDIDTGSGSTDLVGIVSDPSAAASITVDTGAGSVEIVGG